MKLLYFDYCALIILVALIFTSIVRGMTRGRVNKCFINLLIVSGVSTIADIISVLLDGNAAIPVAVRYLAKSSNAIFAVWDFNDVTFDNGEQPKMAKLKLKAKKFVYYKIVLFVDDYNDGEKYISALDKTATVTSIDIRSRQTGYAK